MDLLLFYNGPTPPAGIFSAFVALKSKAVLADIGTRSLKSLVTSPPTDATAGLEGRFHSVTLEGFSLSLLEQIVNQTKVLNTFWSSYQIILSMLS